MKKTVSLILCAALLASAVLCGCGGDVTDSRKATASTDKYRNFYEIFTQSYCDSDGDAIGDLQGIISQLDYLNDGDPDKGDDLGIDGIWLTPIMPSKSYHKYDVENYYDIDPSFGTLDTFDTLVEECHKRGIKLIIDLVLNHISSNNPLFAKAVDEVMDGNLDGNAKYFEIHKKDYFSPDTQVVALGDYACEANFSQTMPEWNLNSEATREEFTKIAKFWLDRGVDGFRLDACKFYTNKETNGEEFLEWFVSTCREIIMEMLNTQKGKALVSKVSGYDKKMRGANPDQINAMFLSNHDQVRIANALESKGLDYEKFAASVYMLFPGNSFTYYGEEIGMTAPNPSGDANYRTPMVFDSDDMPKIYVQGAGDTFEPPTNGGVKQQLKDKDSLLNFYRKIIKAKLQNPEIQRGRITSTPDMGDDTVGAFVTEYDGKQVMILHNFDSENAKQLTITDEMLKTPELVADLSTGAEKAGLSGTELKLPAHGSVILRVKDS